MGTLTAALFRDSLLKKNLATVIRCNISSRFVHNDINEPKKGTATEKKLDEQNVSSSVPWYLRPEKSPRVVSHLNEISMPELPRDHPGSLKLIVEYLVQKLGMDDVKVFDLRDDFDQVINDGAKLMSNFMVIGTGKSAKHLQKAAELLNYFLKHKLNEVPSTEGLFSNGEFNKIQRRLKKKGRGAPQYAKFSYGASPNTWVMMDCKIDGIYVHMLTKERRENLNLENLWSKDKSKYPIKQSKQKNDNILSGLRFYHTSTSNGNCQPFSLIRTISTVEGMTAKAFNPFTSKKHDYRSRFRALKNLHLSNPESCPLEKIKDHYDAMQANGFPLTYNDVFEYLDLVFVSPEFYRGITRDADVYNKRYQYALKVLRRYRPALSNPESIKKLLFLFTLAGSQYDNSKFITIYNVESLSQETANWKNIFRYSPRIHMLRKVFTHFSSYFTLSDLALMDVICLSIFINRGDWFSARNVIEYALKRADYNVLICCLRLIAVNGNVNWSQKFLDEYYPLLQKSRCFKMENEIYYIKLLLSHSDPSGNHYRGIRENL